MKNWIQINVIYMDTKSTWRHSTMTKTENYKYLPKIDEVKITTLHFMLKSQIKILVESGLCVGQLGSGAYLLLELDVPPWHNQSNQATILTSILTAVNRSKSFARFFGKRLRGFEKCGLGTLTMATPCESNIKTNPSHEIVKWVTTKACEKNERESQLSGKSLWLINYDSNVSYEWIKTVGTKSNSA